MEIQPTTDEGLKRTVLAGWVADKVQPLLDEISADVDILDGSPTNADVIAIVRRSMVRQRKIINGVVRLVSSDIG